MVGAEQRKARPEKEVSWNGSDSRGAVVEHRVRPQMRAVMRRLRWAGVTMRRIVNVSTEVI